MYINPANTGQFVQSLTRAVPPPLLIYIIPHYLPLPPTNSRDYPQNVCWCMLDPQWLVATSSSSWRQGLLMAAVYHDRDGPDRRRIPRSGCQALVRRPLLQLPRHKCRRRPWPPQMSWYDEKSDRHRPTSPRPPSGGPNAPPINATSPTSPGESAVLCCMCVTLFSPTPGTAVSPY